MSYESAVQDFATRKALTDHVSMLRNLDERLSRLIQNDTLNSEIVTSGFPVITSEVEPINPAYPADWYKPASATAAAHGGEYYKNIEDSTGTWYWSKYMRGNT